MPPTNIWRIDGQPYVKFSDGPDRHRASNQCVDQHDGVREGIHDSCCCCDPCRYVHVPKFAHFTYCCRCIPRLLCVRFVPDTTTNECCKPIGLQLFPEFISQPTLGGNSVVVYAGSIVGHTVSLSIKKDSYESDDGPCYWVIESPTLGVDDRIEIDHVNVNCLSVPGITITGVTDENGCLGTIVFSNYDAVKLPFHKDISQPPDDVLETILPTWQGGYPQCDCQEVPKYLCVDGIRHVEPFAEREQVVFIWDEVLGDRWSYSPCDGHPVNDQEHIYLRGDSHGNCYLELDFEHTGGDTNDWAVPPNNYDGTNPYVIRDGLLPIKSCGINIHAHSQNDDFFRFVNINAGKCYRWRHHCAKCRCVPNRVCVIGEIDGEIIVGEALWNGSGWASSGSGGVDPFLIELVASGCNDSDNDCVLKITGSFSIPFENSSPVACGEYLSGEVYTKFDSYFPTTFNWLWISATPCICEVGACGLCIEERCGGPPKTLYYEIEGNAVPTGGFGYGETCNITVEVHYYERLFYAGEGSRPTLYCGYIGHKVVTCPGEGSNPAYSFVVRVSASASFSEHQVAYMVTRAELDGSPLYFANIFGPPLNGLSGKNAVCDPFVLDSGWYEWNARCWWGCSNHPTFDIRETLVE